MFSPFFISSSVCSISSLLSLFFFSLFTSPIKTAKYTKTYHLRSAFLPKIVLLFLLVNAEGTEIETEPETVPYGTWETFIYFVDLIQSSNDQDGKAEHEIIYNFEESIDYVVTNQPLVINQNSTFTTNEDVVVRFNMTSNTENVFVIDYEKVATALHVNFDGSFTFECPNSTLLHTASPTSFPSAFPTLYPTLSPSSAPTPAPTEMPSSYPSTQPTSSPSTMYPSAQPSPNPTISPSSHPSTTSQSSPVPTQSRRRLLINDSQVKSSTNNSTTTKSSIKSTADSSIDSATNESTTDESMLNLNSITCGTAFYATNLGNPPSNLYTLTLQKNINFRNIDNLNTKVGGYQAGDQIQDLQEFSPLINAESITLSMSQVTFENIRQTTLNLTNVDSVLTDIIIRENDLTIDQTHGSFTMEFSSLEGSSQGVPNILLTDVSSAYFAGNSFTEDAYVSVIDDDSVSSINYDGESNPCQPQSACKNFDSSAPTLAPTAPTFVPTQSPSLSPTSIPTNIPTQSPTRFPTTASPTLHPTFAPPTPFPTPAPTINAEAQKEKIIISFTTIFGVLGLICLLLLFRWRYIKYKERQARRRSLDRLSVRFTNSPHGGGGFNSFGGQRTGNLGDQLNSSKQESIGMFPSRHSGQKEQKKGRKGNGAGFELDNSYNTVDSNRSHYVPFGESL